MTYHMSVAAAPVFGLHREIDRLLEDTFGRDGWTRNGAAWSPVVDVREDERELTLTLEVPGVAPSDVEITADNGVLTIRGQKHESRGEGVDAARSHVRERAYGHFARSFQLPAGLADARIVAQYEHGVLTIHVPKAALPQPRRISIDTRDLGTTARGEPTETRKA